MKIILVLIVLYLYGEKNIGNMFAKFKRKS